MKPGALSVLLQDLALPGLIRSFPSTTHTLISFSYRLPPVSYAIIIIAFIWKILFNFYLENLKKKKMKFQEEMKLRLLLILYLLLKTRTRLV